MFDITIYFFKEVYNNFVPYVFWVFLILFRFPNANNLENNVTLDFKELLANPHLKINDLLSIKGILAEVKNSGDTFGDLYFNSYLES